MSKSRSNQPQVLNLILDEMKGIRADLKEVRQNDIPALRTEMAVVKSASGRSAKLITGVGLLVSTATAAAIAYFKH